jgi:ABC-type Na+ efflux pump permease subunit
MKIPEDKKRTDATKKIPAHASKKSWWSSLLFWKKDKNNEYSGETFQTKREREAKKRKHRLVMIGLIVLIMLSTITGIGVPLLSHMNMGSQKDVPNKTLSNDSSDEAAKQILEGKTVKVNGKDSSKKMIDATKAQKALQDAVNAQETKDKDTINKSNDQLAKLQSQVDSLTKANQSLTNQNSSSSSNASTSSSSAAAAMSSAQDQINQYKKTASDAQSKASSLQSELDSTNSKLKDAQSQQTSASSTSSTSSSSK